jgi:O-antigen ligase
MNKILPNPASLYSLLEKAGFYCIVIIALFTPFSKSVVSIASALLLLCYLIAIPRAQKKAALRHPLVYLLLLCWLWTLVGCFYSPDLSTAFDQWKGHIVWLYPLIMFPFLYQQERRININLIVLAIVFSFFLCAIYLNYFILPRPYAIEFHGGDYPVPTNHFTTAIIFMYIIFSCYFFALKTENRYLKWALWGLCGLTIIAELGLNTSRMGYLTEFSILFILFITRWRWRGLLSFIILGALLVTLSYNFSPVFYQRIHEGFHNSQQFFKLLNKDVDPDKAQHIADTSFGIRLFHLVVNTHMMLESGLARNLLGYGTGSYLTQESNYLNSLPAQSPFYKIHPAVKVYDNNYLRFWVDNGLIGVFVFLFTGLWLYHQALYIRQPYQGIARIAMLILLIASAAANMEMFILQRLILLPAFFAFMLWPRQANT